MFTTNIQEIAHIRQFSNAPITDVLHLLEDAYYTLAHGISLALEAECNLTGTVIDNEWTEFEITIIPSANVAIMPHMVEIEGTIYNVDYAVRVLACYLNSVEFMRLQERVVKIS
jgi:hypothetical protein